ncbi:MAG: FmdB family zinc ribbon protein [Desulfovibrio sp.]
MPIYEYECEDCKQIFEEWQQGFDEIELDCKVCGGKCHRLISNTSFVLKGSGWYVTDYAGKTPSGASASESGNGNGNGNGKAEGANPAETKAAKREEAKAAACPGKTASPGTASIDTSA